MKQKRVLIFSLAYHPLIGGAEIALHEIVRRVSPKDLSFELVTMRFSHAHPKRERIGNAVVHRVGIPRAGYFNKILFVPLAALKGVRLHRQKPFDGAWAMMTYMLFPIVVMRAFGVRVPYLITLQDGDTFARVFKRFYIAPFLPLLRYGFRRATAVQSISHYLDQWARQFGFSGKVSVIPNGADTLRFAGVLPIKTLKKKAGETLLITVSRLVEKNAVDDIIRALAKLPRTVRLIVVGGGREMERLQLLARELRVSERVLFVGTVPYALIPAYLKAADIFVRPSRSEGMGSAFIEAMAAGIPVIATRVGGIPDFLIEPSVHSGQVGTGLFCEVNNPESIAEKVQMLMRDKALGNRLVKEASRMVREHYDWNRIAGEMRNLAFAPLFMEREKRKKLRRLLVATPLFPPDIGGPATYAKILLDELPAHGISASIVPFGAVRHLPKILRHFAYFFLVLWQALRAEWVLALDPVSAGLPALCAAKLLRKRFLLKVVGDYAWEQGVQRFGVTEPLDTFAKRREGYSFTVRLFKWVELFVAASAECVIVPSRYLKGIVASWGVPPHAIKVIYNSFNPPMLSENRALLRGLLHFDGRLMLSASRLVPWKGFEILIECLPELRKIFPDLALMIVGSGPELARLEELVEKRGLTGAATFAGSLPHEVLMRYLEAADIFVLNTAYEGFSHQLLEAMAVGTPVVTTNIGGNPELIANGKEGLLVTPDDRKAIVSAVTKIFHDHAFAKGLTAAARTKAHSFGKERMLRELVAVLKH